MNPEYFQMERDFMKLFYQCILFLAMTAFGLAGYSQAIQRCGSNEWDDILRAKYPDLQNRIQLEEWIQRNMHELPNREIQQVYTIPVIVHVVHDGEPIGVGTNISAAQVYSQIEVLNEDFRRINGTPGFNSHPDGADVEIEFCPATISPDNQFLPEPGINRINRNVEGFSAPPYSLGYSGNTIQQSTYWDPEKYCNIWTIHLADNFLGYAQVPNASGLSDLPGYNGPAETDGVVITPTAFGREGNLNAPYNKGRTTTHEIGHWLGLWHIWGDANCGEDFCMDTPEAEGPHYGCPPSQFSCGSENMISNYMDYTDDACMNIFTNCQKTRMRTVIANATRRSSLLNSNTCATNIPPAADFAATHIQVCKGSKIQFFDQSQWSPDSWQWIFPGGEPATSSVANPFVSYDQPGEYDVTLIVSNANGTDTLIQNQFVSVVEPTPVEIWTLDFENGFEDWELDNPDNSRTWTIATVGGANNGDQAAFVNLYSYPAVGEKDGLISPSIDMSAYWYLQLDFEHAYRPFSSAENDSLLIKLSFDGGITYPITVFSEAEDGSGNFATNDESTTNFVPASAEDWCHSGTGWAACQFVDLQDFSGQTDVRIKFETVNDYGNNIFLDNIRLSGICKPVRVSKDEEIVQEIQVFPNPTSDFLDIELADPGRGEISIELWNQMGQRVRQEMSSNSRLRIDVQNLSKGTYFLKVSNEKLLATKKVLIY